MTQKKFLSSALGASIGWFVWWSVGMSTLLVCLTQILAKKSRNLSYLSKGVIGESLIGANVVRAHERFPCGGRRSGH